MAIPLFVKVTPFAAKKMQLDKLRFKTADGNYLLRQSDFLAFGPLSRLKTYADKVGGVILPDADAAANQRGEMNTPLPIPTDPEWVAPDEDVTDTDASVETDEDEVTADAGNGDGVSDDDDADDDVEPETDEAGEGDEDE